MMNEFQKITAAELSEGVTSLPLRPNQTSQFGKPPLSGKELQQRFDYLAKEVIATRFNALIDILSSNTVLEYFKLPEEYSLKNLAELIKNITDTQGKIVALDPENTAKTPLNQILQKYYLLLVSLSDFLALDDQEDGKHIGDIYATIAALTQHNTNANAHDDIRKSISDLTASFDNDISAHNESAAAHNDIRYTLSNISKSLGALEDVINEFLTGTEDNDGTIDRLKEIVAYIQTNKNLIDSLRDDKVAKTDIVDTLDNTDTTKVLAASVGAKIIKAISDAVQGKITDADLTAVLKSYVTISSLNTKLESYVLKKDLDMSGSGISDEMKEILTDVYESNGSLGLEYDLSFGVCLGIGDCKYTDIVVGNVVRGTTISKMRTQAFEGTHITSVELLDSQWLLFGYTFKNCYDLKNAILGNGTVNIAYQDFCDCVNLERISIPKTVTYISEECFAGCVKLADVYFEGTIAEWNAIEIDIGNEYLTNARIHCSDGTLNLEV